MILLSKTTYRSVPYAKNIVFLCLAIFAFNAAAFADTPLPTEPAALDFAKIYALQKTDPNLTGKDVLIAAICPSLTYINGQPQKDYRFNMNHDCLYSADVLFMDGTDGQFGISEHATAIAGVLLGFDGNATYPDIGTFKYQGACPDASVDVYEFEEFSILHLLGDRPITEDILLLSFGDMFETWWVRALEQTAAREDFLVVASIGNGTNADTPKPLYPAAGSNVLGVGVIDAVTDADGTIHLRNFSTPKAVNSSIGPTEDKRCKPDIVAPGTALVPAADNENEYTLKHNWSSLAGPIVAGTAALLEQKALSDDALKKDFDRPGKSLVLKAVLMNSARKLPYWHKGQISENDDHETPLDYMQGAGLLDALAAGDQLTAGMGKPGAVKTLGWDNRILQGNNAVGYAYAFDVTEPNQVITATVCWNRAYEAEYPFNHALDKDTDLRLELWGIDLNDPEKRVLLDYSDSVNDNVEHIYFACDPNYTAYAVRVRFNEQQPLDAAKQRFAVAWSVGPDRQFGDPWWNDLNADDQVDNTDQLIEVLIENGSLEKLDQTFLQEALNVSPERLQLLTANWPAWKPYLAFGIGKSQP